MKRHKSGVLSPLSSRSSAYSSALNVAEPHLLPPASLHFCTCESVSSGLRFELIEPRARSFLRLQVTASLRERQVRVADKWANNRILWRVLGKSSNFTSGESSSVSDLSNQLPSSLSGQNLKVQNRRICCLLKSIAVVLQEIFPIISERTSESHIYCIQMFKSPAQTLNKQHKYT